MRIRHSHTAMLSDNILLVNTVHMTFAQVMNAFTVYRGCFFGEYMEKCTAHALTFWNEGWCKGCVCHMLNPVSFETSLLQHEEFFRVILYLWKIST